MLVIFGDGSVFSELIMERSQQESWRSEQAAHMFRTGWELLQVPISQSLPTKRREGRRFLLFCWGGGGRERNEKWKMREGWEESAFFLLLGGLVLDKAFDEENAMFGFSNT